MAKKRAQVSSSDKWDVEAMYPTFEAWQEAFTAFRKEKGDFSTLNRYRGKLGQSLKAFLDEYFATSREIEKLYTYAHLRHDEDIRAEKEKGAYQTVLQLYHTFGVAMSWAEPEILHLDNLDALIADPSLQTYAVYLQKLAALRAHTLSDAEENLLALASQPLQTASQAFGSLNNADLKFAPAKDGKGEEKEVTHGLYGLYLQSPDRTLRKNAFESMHTSFKEHENTITELLNGVVQKHLFGARARKYESCVEAALFPNQIDTAVYRNLIDTVRREIAPLHDYLGFRKKLLGVDTLHFYDLYVPCGEHDFAVSFDEAIDHCIDSVHPLGDTYKSDLARGLTKERWCDRYENEGKRSGAYSSGCFDSPPYILMNFKGTHSDLTTLAHEAGHSMHSLYSHKHQPYHYSSYSIFVAEVASTFNEELLFRHLMEKARSKEEKAFLLNRQIDGIRGTLFRQTLFAEFELRIHEMAERGEPITPGALKDLYGQLNRDYYGPHLTIDELLPYEYLRIPHFYYNFYVYQYATGISAAHALVENVIERGKRDDYLGFLSAGSSDYPVEVLKKAGVDMRTPKAVESLIAYFGGLVNQLKDCQ